MTASIVSSSYVTNAKANPPVQDPLGAHSRAKVRVIMGTMELATTSIDEIGDKAMLFNIKGNERLISLKIFNDDLDSGSALAINVGLYKDVSPAGTAATAVSAACYASAITTLQAANVAGVDLIQSSSAARNIDKMGQDVAADGGESAHSNTRTVGIAASTAAGTPVAGSISWIALVISP